MEIVSGYAKFIIIKSSWIHVWFIKFCPQVLIIRYRICANWQAYHAPKSFNQHKQLPSKCIFVNIAQLLDNIEITGILHSSFDNVLDGLLHELACNGVVILRPYFS